MTTFLAIFSTIMSLILFSGFGFIILPILGIGILLFLLPAMCVSLMVTQWNPEQEANNKNTEDKTDNTVEAITLKEIQPNNISTNFDNVVPLFKESRSSQRAEKSAANLGSISVSMNEDGTIRLAWIPSCRLSKNLFYVDSDESSSSIQVRENRAKHIQRHVQQALG